MRKNFIKQKNGFTVAELVVVMFLLGLVAIIAISVTLMVNRTQQNYKIDSKSQNEILKLESAFKDYLMLFDLAEFELIIDDNSIDATKDTISAMYPIKFENGTLSYYGTDGLIETKFDSVEDITFDAINNIVCCSVKLKNTDYQHKILYTLRAATIWNLNSDSAGDNNE